VGGSVLVRNEPTLLTELSATARIKSSPYHDNRNRFVLTILFVDNNTNYILSYKHANLQSKKKHYFEKLFEKSNELKKKNFKNI